MEVDFVAEEPEVVRLRMRDSTGLCRICGKEKESTQSIFAENDTQEKDSLRTDLQFFLPLELRDESPFPRRICQGCFDCFQTFCSFFVDLNKGQLNLSRLLFEQEGVSIPMPDLMARPLFTAKFPSCPKAKPPPKPPRAKKAAKAVASINKNEAAADDASGGDKISRSGPGKRARKLPKRLQESVQGSDLDKLFRPESAAQNQSQNSNRLEVKGGEIGKNVGEESLLVKCQKTPKDTVDAPSSIADASGGNDVENSANDVNKGLVADVSDVTGMTARSSRTSHHHELEGGESALLTQLDEKPAAAEVFANPHLQLSMPTGTPPSCDSFVKGQLSPPHQPLVLAPAGSKEEEEETGKQSLDKSSLYKCDFCTQRFKSMIKMSQHKKDSHFGTYLSCDGCDKSFKARNNLVLHQGVTGHSGHSVLLDKVALTCAQCHVSFGSERELKSHVSAKHQDHACPHCDRKFAYASSLSYHVETAHRPANSKNGGAKFECKPCNKTFRAKQIFSRHMAVVHSDARPYACNVCDMKFKSTTNLKAHQISHSKEKKFACQICEKKFSYRTSLVQHLRWHEGDRSFKCPHCDKSFIQNGNLQEHIRIHTGDKPFSCSICGRKFTTSSQQKLHEKRHRGEKPFKCEFCPKAFLHKESFTAHTRRHKGDRPFECATCNKTFTEAWALKKHMRLHTGEKPYECPTCKKSFSDCSNLAKHRRTHEREFASNMQQQQQLDDEANDVLVHAGDVIDHHRQPPPFVATIQEDGAGEITLAAAAGSKDHSVVGGGEVATATDGKAQVWNILNEANAAAAATTSSLLENAQLIAAGEPDESIQQIIYVSYEPAADAVVEDDSSVKVHVPTTSSEPVVTSSQEENGGGAGIDLGPLSSLQLPEVISSQSTVQGSKEVDIQILQALGSADEANLTNQGHLQPSDAGHPPIRTSEIMGSVSSQDVGGGGGHTVVEFVHEPLEVATTSASAATTSQHVVGGPPSSLITQENLQVLTDADLDGAAAAAADGSHYVDVRLREGERPVRVLVARNLDPMSYIAEYVQQIILPNSDVAKES